VLLKTEVLWVDAPSPM